MWLTPPERKIQMTFFALGAKCVWPVGGDQSSGAFARAMPSCQRSEPRARPAHPNPRSLRKERLVLLAQRHEGAEFAKEEAE
jgi:hypothetical protein